MGLVISRDLAIKIRTEAKQNNINVGFISGSFDLLHALHVETLQNAKRETNGLLFIGLNSDSSVKRYKNPNRPIINQEDRAKMLCALECTDYIFIFDEINNNENIKLLQPDFYIKGMDYKNKPMTSRHLIESYGGKVILVPPPSGTNTSDIIRNIVEREINETKNF